MTEPIPINAPSRVELWRRNQVALSVLGHRALVPVTTRDLLVAILHGEDVAVAESKGGELTGAINELGPPDIRQALAEARREADDPMEDGPYRELMATYAAVGELLQSGREDADLDLDCRDLVGRLLKLGVWVDRQSDQRWALWIASGATFREGG